MNGAQLHNQIIGCAAAIALCALSLMSGPACAADSAEKRKTFVLITVDVCWTCGSDFEGHWRGKDYGVPLIVEMLDRRGIKGTFFVSPYCPADRESRLMENLRFLVNSGHDIQLHTHTDVFDLNRLKITQYTRKEKLEILHLGRRNIVSAGAPAPIAHRAGGYAIDRETLQLLPEAGLVMDSSVFPGSPKSRVPLPRDKANRFVPLEGPYQLPITLMQLIPFIGYRGATSLSLERTTWEQQKQALDLLADGGVPVVTVFMHFSSLYRHRPSPVPYEPHSVLGPDTEKIHAFQNILDTVTRDPRFAVKTVPELWRLHQTSPEMLQGPPYIPQISLITTYLTSWRHFFGHSWKKKALALAPPVGAIVAIGGLAAYVRSRRRRRQLPG